MSCAVGIQSVYPVPFTQSNVIILKGKRVVFTGVSGSGKSSLAFDTIAVESSREWQQSYPLIQRNKMPHYHQREEQA